MKIHIKNFNNISELFYSIEDKKINFLFGISGSGKSSIAKALTAKKLDESNIKIGKKSNDVLIRIDKKTPKSFNAIKFDSEYVENLLVSRTEKNDVFSIVFGDDDEIKDAKETYEKTISCIVKISDNIIAAIGHIDILESKLKTEFYKKTDKNNPKIKSTSLFFKTENSFAVNPLIRTNNAISSSKVKWLEQGTQTNEFANHVCPFCGAQLTSQKENEVINLSKFDAASLERIEKETGTFNYFNIELPNWTDKNELRKFYKKIYKLLSFKAVLIQLSTIVQIKTSTDFSELNISKDVKPISLPKGMSSFLPMIYSAVRKYNKKIIEVKKSLGCLKNKTDLAIKRNCGTINNALSSMGIPYAFIATKIDGKNRELDFCLKHKDDKENIDRTNCLSYGEKNTIGLLLFLLSKKNNIIIDDPASSFDDFRRKIILDYIYKVTDGSRTVLVLSHDHVFMKNALLYSSLFKGLGGDKSELQKKYEFLTGKICFLESFDGVSIKNIDAKDFKSISECVVDYLKKYDGQRMNYQIALNLRIFYELRKKDEHDVYSYLSGMLHRKKYTELAKEWRMHGFSQRNLLKQIKEDTNLSFKAVNRTYIPNPDFSQMTLFEKVIYAREKTTNSTRYIRDQISGIVHLNDAYAICLNPYKFNYFSESVYSFVKEVCV